MRLAAYWAEALGGPPLFSTTHGDETSAVRMHSGNGRHEEMDRYHESAEDVPDGLAIPKWSWDGLVE